MVASFVWGYAIPGDEMEITSRKNLVKANCHFSSQGGRDSIAIKGLYSKAQAFSPSYHSVTKELVALYLIYSSTLTL